MPFDLRLRAFAGALLLTVGSAAAEDMPGITRTEIKLGQTMPYSGPVSAYGMLGIGDVAMIRMINDQGGINGRRITLLSLDDGYNPAKAVELTRQLVEQDHVAFLFSSLGTATNSAVRPYLNQNKVPQLFLASGSEKWADPKHYPWTMSWQGSFRTEAQIYAKYILAHRPNARIGFLYQNDDFGKDYLAGVKDVLGDRYARMVVKEASYEPTDPTIDSQIVSIEGAGADTLITVATPKFAAQAIRKAYDLGWHPLHFLTNVSVWVSTVMQPAGPEKGIGIISSAYGKDPTDPAWKDDPGMRQWHAFMAKYLPDRDPNDGNFINSYGIVETLVQVLKQCGDDLSRENVMRQAANLHGLVVPTLLPGITISTGPADYHPIKQMQLMRWDGKTWVRFGGIISGAGPGG